MKGLLVVVVLIATLVSQGTAQLPFGPQFHISQYRTTEGDTLVVRLSAPVLTRPQIPPFNGSIEVDITAEDLPGGNAEFRSDYIVNSQNPLSRTFTVTFQPNQANSTENTIQVADDSIVEGTEAFRLRIVAARFFREAAAIFRAPAGLTNIVADVTIEDDDFIAVSWIISEPIPVREGKGVRLELFAKASGLYATPIEIGVVCAEVIATGVPPAYPDRDFRVLSGSTLEFTDVETLRSNSSNNLTLSIIDDEIAEPCESFICTLQGGSVDRVRGVEPNRVTVRICDDDELLVHWAQDVYEFDESQITGTVELVTDSTFEVERVSIQGFPRQIPDGDPNRFPSLVLPGPSFPGTGFSFDATIERVFVRVPSPLFGDRIFGNAQVTQSGRSDAVNTINDFVFTPNSTSVFENFTIVDDDVLEFDEIFIAEFSFGPEIANNWNARQVEPITAFILIRDDDSVDVNFNENSYTVAESDGQVSVSLRIDGQFFVPVWAIVEISDGTATDPEDYSGTGPYNVTFRQTVFTDGDDPASTALSSPILIDITNDNIFEGVEYFQARIVETSDRFRVRIGQDTVNITITDSVTVNYEEEMYRVDEEAESVTLALVLDGEASVNVTVTVRTQDLLNSSYGDAATSNVDYTPREPFEITFLPGSTRQEYTVNISDDFIPENSEFFNADIDRAGPAGVIIGEPRQPVIEILDRVDIVTVQYDQELYSVEEEAGPVTLALVLDRTVPFPVTVIVNTLDLQDSSVGDAATADVDYTPRGPFEITFPAGSIRQEYTVNIIDDSLPENSEFFNADVNLVTPEDASFVAIGRPKQPLIEIQDMDAVVAISLDRAAYSIVENEQVVTVNLTLNDTYREDIEVNVTVGELLVIPDLERAQAGVDFSTDGFPTQVTIPAGQTSVQFNISVIDELLVERDEQFQVSFTYSGSQPGVVVRPDFDEAIITISNDDALMVMFERDSYSVREDAGSLMYRVIATGNASFDYEVVITGVDGSATCGSDYHDPIDDSSGTVPPVMSCSYSLTITIPAGSSAGDGVVAIINDTVYEGLEDFFLDLSVAQTFQQDGINEGSPLRATVEIEDDDELRVFFDPAVYSVPEGENQVLVLRADNVFAVPFTIDVTLRDGTAVAPGDYEDRSYQVVFNVTTQTGTLVVHTETDNVIENNENFTAVLSVPVNLPRVFEGTPSEATVTILDQTTAEVYFDPATYNVTEGQPADLILRLTRDVDPSVTIIVRVQTRDGSATNGTDYTGGLYTATFSGNSTTSVQVPTLPDNVLEGLETFTGVIQVPPETTTSYRVTAGSPDTATVNIIDATIAGVYFDPDVYSVNEGGTVTLILRTNVTVNKRFSVLVNTLDDSATSPEDYLGGERRAIFEIGSSMATVEYTTVNDSIREGIESFIANLTVPPEMEAMGIVPGMPASATVTIPDDEVLVCMLVRTMHEVREDMGPLVAMVMCSIPSDEPFTLIVQTSDGTAVDGEDYTGGDYPVIFPAGSTKESFSIPITDDDIFETDETFFLTLVIPPPAQVIGVMRGDPFMATVTIINDEAPVTILMEEVMDVIENQEFVEVCLVKSGPSSRPIMALVNAEELTGNAGSPVSIDATSQVDFEPDVPMITLAPSETRKCVNVTIINDDIVERMEPFEVIITFPPGQPALQIGEIVPSGMQINDTINIIDDDAITVEFEQDMYMVEESDGMVDVTVIASGRTSFEYTFTVTPMDLTATNNFDYTYPTTTYSFGPTDENERIPSLVISIPIINDSDNEFDEDFKLTLEVSAEGEAANVTEGPINMTVVLIKDDDDVTVTFNPQNYTVTEGDPAPLMIILDKPAAKDITVTVTTMDITATAPIDYTGGSFGVSIPAGSVKVALNVSTLRDSIVEPDEYFKATLSLSGAPEGCVVGTPDMSYITIIEDSPMIPVRFNPANYSVKEGVDGNAVIVLEALANHNFDFTVTVNSQDGTAFDGSDYTGGPFEVTFPAGVNVVSFNVSILDDAIAECAKLFNLDLDIPQTAAGMGVIRGSPDTATVHIMDDDVEDLFLSIENADYMVKENVGSFVAAVIASRAADFNYTVTVETSDGTAVGGEDFVSQQYQLTFQAGQTRDEFTVVITDDNLIEAMESFQLLLSIPEDLISKGVQVGLNSAATVTIMDNDVQVKFSQSSVATTEEEGRVFVTVEAMGDLSSNFSIIVMAINGSAVEPFDFTGNMWPVDFIANQTSAIFPITIVQDNLAETPEEFSLKIVIESPYDERVTVGVPSRLTVVITDRKNDTVRGDPLFSIPLPSKYTAHTELGSIQLCFEIHGQSGSHYNFISDACTSVSARYKQGENDAGLNVISNIGVKAKGSNDACHNIEVDLDRCSAQLDGTLLNTSSVTVNGISIVIRRQRVRVSVPNCASSTRLIMWMICTMRNSEDMLEFVVSRGDGLLPTAHGLIGQFWNVPVNITSYTGPYGDGTAAPSDRIYSVTVAYPNATERTFIADYGKKDWLDNRPCLYAGNHNGGPIWEVPGSDSVIEGKYSDYEVADLFATDYGFSKFKANC